MGQHVKIGNIYDTHMIAYLEYLGFHLGIGMELLPITFTAFFEK